MPNRKNLTLSVAASAAALLLLFTSGLAMAAEAPEVDQYELDNGMQVVVIPDHRTPVVVHSVWYRVGGADEPYGKSGIAHFLEHLMFKGTKEVPAGEFSKIVARNGGQDNAFTAQDYTGYYQMVAKDRLPLVMKMEADRMVNLQLTDDVVYPERKVIIEERRSRIDNQPGAILGEQMNALQFLHHQYGEPLIGWLDEMQKLTREDAEAFYHRFYTPTDAILIVVGDVTGEEVLELAKTYYGVLPRREVPPSNRVQEPQPRAPRTVTFTHPDVGQPMWRRSYLAPSAHKGETELAPALEVLSQYLGGGTLSQLYQSLVVRQKIAAAAGGFYTAEQKDLSTFDIYAIPAPGQDLGALEAAVDAEIDRVKAGDIDMAAVDRAKTLLKATVIYSRDNIMSMMRIYGTVITAGLPVSYITDWEKNIDAVTIDDLKAAADAVLQPERSVTGELLPAKAGAPQEAAEPQAALQQPSSEPAEQ